ATTSLRSSLMSTLHWASPKPHDMPLLLPPSSEDLAHVFCTLQERSSPTGSLFNTIVQSRFSQALSAASSPGGSSIAKDGAPHDASSIKPASPAAKPRCSLRPDVCMAAP